MRFVRYLLYFIAICGTGCAPDPENPRVVAQGEVRAFADDFYDAVASRDAARVYALVAANEQISRQDFETIFSENYDIFMAHAIRLRDDAATDVVHLSAQRRDDPCASVDLVFEDDRWQISTVPSPEAARTVEERKQDLISLIQTHAFMSVFDAYGTAHPELDAARMRQIKRYIAYETIPVQNVSFSGNVATVSVAEDARIFLTCSPQGWSLSQCIFIP